MGVAELTGGEYFPAESADELSEVFAGLPTTHIMATEAVEISAGFVGVGAALCAVALLLGRAWRPLP
jgi:Ca-activated chloride channel family protein